MPKLLSLDQLNFIHTVLSSIASPQYHFASTFLYLHSKITCILLLIAILILAKEEFYGYPIHCEGQMNLGVRANKYCYYYGLFIIRNSSKYIDDERGKEIFRLEYYSWFLWILMLNMLIFHTPVLMWETNAKHFRTVLTTHNCHNLLQRGKSLFALSFKCDLMCLLNCVFQFNFFDVVFNNYFMDIGIVWYRNQRVNNNLMHIFPRLAKCIYIFCGPSGTDEKRDFLCEIYANNAIEKIVVIYWFWLVFISTIGCFEILRNIMIIFLPFTRKISTRIYKHRTTITNNLGHWFIYNKLCNDFEHESILHAIEYYKLYYNTEKHCGLKPILTTPSDKQSFLSVLNKNVNVLKNQLIEEQPQSVLTIRPEAEFQKQENKRDASSKFSFGNLRSMLRNKPRNKHAIEEENKFDQA